MNVLRQNPQAVTSATSNRWVSEILDACKANLANAKKVAIPILIFQAGNDAYVMPKEQDEFCAKAKNCIMIKIAGSRHEIYFEQDQYRNREMVSVENFFAQH